MPHTLLNKYVNKHIQNIGKIMQVIYKSDIQ